jgi:predicted nucleic acid-binding protein
MAIQYIVRATVVDIRQDTPGPHDMFLVDSNVWYWLTYSRASQADQPPYHYQTYDYPEYINRARAVGASLLRCELSLAELAHLIERTERDIWLRRSAPASGSPKEYRHNYPSERANVVAEIDAAWSQVKSLAKPLAVQVDESLADAALVRLQSQPLDAYDLFLIEAAARTGTLQFITDDGDFATVPGIIVFTSNHHLIRTAQAQGRLVQR